MYSAVTRRVTVLTAVYTVLYERDACVLVTVSVIPRDLCMGDQMRLPRASLVSIITPYSLFIGRLEERWALPTGGL